MARLFGTDGVRGIANTELTCDLAFRLGQASAAVLASDVRRPTILVGRDTRSHRISAAISRISERIRQKRNKRRPAEYRADLNEHPPGSQCRRLERVGFERRDEGIAGALRRNRAEPVIETDDADRD